MQFKVSDKKPKATIEIDGVEYKVFAPTLGQSDEYSEQYELAKENSKKISDLMQKYISQLGSIPLDKVKKIPRDMFIELFQGVCNPEKKS